jgi:uncharacterized protein
MDSADEKPMHTPDARISPYAQGWLIRLGSNMPTWQVIALALLATELLPIALVYVAEWFIPFAPMNGPDLMSHGVVSGVLFACVVAPLAETAFNQWGCITLLRNRLGAGPWTAINVSAALFASMHFYSLKYVLMTFPIGIVLGYVFVLEHMRRGRPFLVVATIHALRNGISVALLLASS